MSEPIDLKKGIHLQVEGELGRYNTLPVAALVKIAENLQRLVQAIAKNDIDSGEAILLSNFQVELAGFHHGSAVPQFVLTPRVQLPLADLDTQRSVVNERFGELMSVAATGNYTELKRLYRDSVRRNEIVHALFDFRNSFDDSPVSIVKLGKGGKLKKEYALKPFKKEIKQTLTTKVVAAVVPREETYAVARVKVLTDDKGKQHKRIQDLYQQARTEVAWAPAVLVHGTRAYVLRYPLMCALEHEGEVHSIHNPILGIIGAGATADEAEHSFQEEFDFIYRRYTPMSDKKLAAHLVEVKRFLKHLVTSIEE